MTAIPGLTPSGGMPGNLMEREMDTPFDRSESTETGRYEKPTLERLGDFRELTRSGGLAFSDPWLTDGTAGCQMNGSSSYTCYQP